MAAAHGKRLAPAYASLDGAHLLKALGEHRETAVLEAFWRYYDADLAASAAEPIVASGDETLLGLVLDEILDPGLDGPAPQAIVQAIDRDRPALATADAERLAERLLDATGLHPSYEPARPSLLAWLVAQPGKLGDEAALEVITRRPAGSEQGSVQQAAYARCRGNSRLLSDAAAVVADEFERAPSLQTWQQAAEFVEEACRKDKTTPEAVRPIVQRLLEMAPHYLGSARFADTLHRHALESAFETIEHVVSQDMADSHGARAMIELLPEITPALLRARVWAGAARAQRVLWPVLQQQATGWDEAEWRRVLRALTGPETVHRSALEYLVAAAPIELTAELMQLVMTQVGVGDVLIGNVGQRLLERLQAIGEGGDTREAWVAAVHWPKQRDLEDLERFSAIIGGVETSLRVRLIVRGYLTKKLRADVAARLVPAGEATRALAMVAVGQRGEWTVALAAAHPDEIASAAGAVTTPDDYDLDVVVALAPVRPDVAFLGVAAAWQHLAADQKDEVVGLLEEHGDEESLEALCAIIRDDHRDNAKRRGRAARRIGELLELGATLPEPVLDLLNSNLHDLRSAAVEAIARVKPREPELIGRLHDVVAGGGAAGKAAADALDALAGEFIAEFDAAREKSELHELMPLLGAVGRSGVLRPLFQCVGGNAIYDDPALHRAAATAIHAAADRIDAVSSDDQEALVALIDGEPQETNVRARDELSSALARIQLGEDAALQLLYDEMGFTPKIEPSRLFGAEKEPLVRQLALFDRARKRGQDGWGAELAHMDNVAERLVRAAYLVAQGTSGSIVEQIQTDSRTPDYGNLITALASAKELNGIQGQCKVLHDARCTLSEIPHAGKQADAATMTTARKCFVDLAKVCVGTLRAHHRPG